MMQAFFFYYSNFSGSQSVGTQRAATFDQAIAAFKKTPGKKYTGDFLETCEEVYKNYHEEQHQLYRLRIEEDF